MSGRRNSTPSGATTDNIRLGGHGEPRVQHLWCHDYRPLQAIQARVRYIPPGDIYLGLPGLDALSAWLHNSLLPTMPSPASCL